MNTNDGLQKFFRDHHISTGPVSGGAISEITWILLRSQATDEMLSLLHELPSLNNICLQDGTITDQGLANISNLTQLKRLDLRSCKNITDEGMRHISNLANLKVLELYDTAIGDDGLSHLMKIASLEELDIHSTKITDTGLKQLQTLSHLRSLHLGGNILTDAGLQFVGSLPQLEKLYLGESNFTDSGLAFLGELTRLTDLSIAWTKITGLGFKHLGNLKKLSRLHASESSFTDENLQYLAPLKNLKEIALNRTNVTDNGLIHLAGLTKLKQLYLDFTRATKAGKAMLKNSLPRCHVFVSLGQEEADLAQFDTEYFWSHPPRCIAGFKPIPQRKEAATTYQLICKCGCAAGFVLGYPLSQFSDYRGTQFVGPLAFRCAACRKTTRIIDTAIHGYDGELGSSTITRGHGKRAKFTCARCVCHEMTVLVHFIYDGGELDLKADDPSIDVQDYFGSFSAAGICTKCGSHADIADFECA